MNQMVSLKLLSITLIMTGLLSGCSIYSTQPSYKLDFYTLTHSAVYTQREMINSLLAKDAGNPAPYNETLLNNYCDLVDRHIIYVSSDNVPQQCSNRTVNHQSRRCAQKFHECIRMCSLRSNNCQPCIKHSQECLE